MSNIKQSTSIVITYHTETNNKHQSHVDECCKCKKKICSIKNKKDKANHNCRCLHNDKRFEEKYQPPVSYNIPDSWVSKFFNGWDPIITYLIFTLILIGIAIASLIHGIITGQFD